MLFTVIWHRFTINYYRDIVVILFFPSSCINRCALFHKKSNARTHTEPLEMKSLSTFWSMQFLWLRSVLQIDRRVWTSCHTVSRNVSTIRALHACFANELIMWAWMVFMLRPKVDSNWDADLIKLILIDFSGTGRSSEAFISSCAGLAKLSLVSISAAAFVCAKVWLLVRNHSTDSSNCF